MKKNIKYLIGFCLLVACNQTQKVKVAIDNPMVSTINVTVDDKTYTVAPEGMQEIELTVGEHTFETKLEQSAIKGSFKVDKEGLLNATGSEYILWNELFLSKEVTPEEAEAIYVSVLKDDSILIDGIKYFGEFTLYDRNTYFIPQKWAFNTITPFPSKPSLTARYETKKKIFRKMPFITEYEERYAFDDKETKRIMDSVINAREKENHK